ncbi:MAG: hypothetical protein R3B13_16615 [Polyangiaceae bacterium]
MRQLRRSRGMIAHMGILIYSADPSTGESLGELEPPGSPWEDLLGAVEDAASELRSVADHGTTARVPGRIPANAFWRILFFAYLRRRHPKRLSLASGRDVQATTGPRPCPAVVP